jgi:predicted ATPase/class 3 adenylate cyclase
VTKLPGGTLTFLFTDVEGSTPLWERHEATMRAVTARHDALLDSIITQCGGWRVRERGEGDSLFVVFTEPAAAVVAALAMAQAVLAEPWPPETPIRVRIGLHTGAAQRRAGDYYGPVVNRCARIRGLGYGGQVLLSATTAALVEHALPAGASLRGLGAHSLKGLSAPEEVFQLCHPSLPAEFPPLLSPRAPRHNLPQTLTGLIGREQEEAEILALLGTTRLVTLTGTGGLGKTRLALAVAAELVDRYPDGVWLVEFAPLADPALVLGAVAQALGLREEPHRPMLAMLGDHLRNKRLLLVLDNCEHLVAACATLASALLRVAPGLHILATSREGLQVAGERIFRVPSLRAPDPRLLPAPESVGSYDAVRLFVARAQDRRRDFALTSTNALAVASVCARLEGVPLAIELAAARVGSMSLDAIAQRLDDRFRLLTSGARDLPSRHRTLRAMLDWSWELLAEEERTLLQRLSVFGGGWTLEAAETVCADHEQDAWNVLDLLDGLVNKSLVGMEERGEGTRYGMLETVRQYARERLAASSEEAAAQDRHLAWCLALAEQEDAAKSGPEQGVWLDRLEQEHDNGRAALDWALQAQHAPEAGLRLALALWWFWWARGHLSEGRRYLEAAVGSGDTVPVELRARALTMLGHLATAQGDSEHAAAAYEESLTRHRDLGNRRGMADALTSLGLVALDRGDLDRALALLEENLLLRRELGEAEPIANSLINLGLVYQMGGTYAHASALYEESLVLYRQLGDTSGIAAVLANMGEMALAQGNHQHATTLLGQSLTLFGEIGHRRGIIATVENLGAVAAAQGEGMRAARLLGAADGLRESIGSVRPPVEHTAYDKALGLVRSAISEHALTAAWAEGRAMTVETVTAYALNAALSSPAAGG